MDSKEIISNDNQATPKTIITMFTQTYIQIYIYNYNNDSNNNNKTYNNYLM